MKILLEERQLRYTVPIVYNRMVETFATYHIHPYDVQALAIKNEEGYAISLRFAKGFSQSITKHFSFEQAKHPDNEVTLFFQEAADKCKSFLIADYYKMMKP